MRFFVFFPIDTLMILPHFDDVTDVTMYQKRIAISSVYSC